MDHAVDAEAAAFAGPYVLAKYRVDTNTTPLMSALPQDDLPRWKPFF